MIHSFKIADKYLVLFVESGKLLEVDKLVYNIINNLSVDGFDENDVIFARQEIAQLINNENNLPLLTKENYVSVKDYNLKALCLHLSHDCNLRCKYCFADTGSYSGERINMDRQVAFKAIDLLISNSIRHNLEVDFFGGEPLINFTVLKETVKYANEQALIHNKQFKFTTTTNGILLNDEISNYLNDTMDNVVLSIDGRPQINDNARPTINNKGSYDLIIDKFKHFAQLRGNKSYYIRGTFTNANLDFSNDVLFLNDIGFKQISVEPVVLPFNHSMAISNSDVDIICNEYEKLAIEYVNRRTGDKWFSFFHFNVDAANGPCINKRLKGCGAGGEYLAIAPNGDIYPCHQFVGNSQFYIGNVLDNTMNNSVRDKLISNNLFNKPACNSCFARYHCGGGCAANAINFNGDANIPYDISCKLMRKRLECALYVYVSENN